MNRNKYIKLIIGAGTPEEINDILQAYEQEVREEAVRGFVEYVTGGMDEHGFYHIAISKKRFEEYLTQKEEE